MRVYLAGPDVFLPNAKERGEKLKGICQEHGLEGLFPLDAVITIEGLAPQVAARKIFDANVAMIQQADGILANMTPFRGPGMDVGTSWEMGFAYCRAIPVVGYSPSEFKHSQRVDIYREAVGKTAPTCFMCGGSGKRRTIAASYECDTCHGSGMIGYPRKPFMDPDFVESFGLHDNLMLDMSTQAIEPHFGAAVQKIAEILGVKRSV